MRTYDVLLNSGDTSSGRLMTKAEALKTVRSMQSNPTCAEYFPVTIVRYQSAQNQTIIDSTTYQYGKE